MTYFAFFRSSTVSDPLSYIAMKFQQRLAVLLAAVTTTTNASIIPASKRDIPNIGEHTSRVLSQFNYAMLVSHLQCAAT